MTTRAPAVLTNTFSQCTHQVGSFAVSQPIGKVFFTSSAFRHAVVPLTIYRTGDLGGQEGRLGASRGSKGTSEGSQGINRDVW